MLGERDHLRWNLNLFDVRRRGWNGFTMQPHAFEMKFNRFANQSPRFFERRTSRYTAREVGNMCAVASPGLFKEHGVLAHFSPACFSIDACVFGSKSSEG